MLSTILGIVSTVTLIIVGWAFQVSSKVNVLDQKHADLTILINFRFDALDARLKRIEQALNGSIKVRYDPER